MCEDGDSVFRGRLRILLSNDQSLKTGLYLRQYAHPEDLSVGARCYETEPTIGAAVYKQPVWADNTIAMNS
jgi:hypothetical protein